MNEYTEKRTELPRAGAESSNKEDHMSESKTWRKLVGASLASMMLFTVGCAQDVGDIDRTQPNKLLKSDFNPDKEFYYRQMVVDTDVQGSVIFQGLMGNLHRVRWEITQNTLYACSTVAPVQGERAEEQFINGRECYSIVAAFPITDHFDVQRSYNAATGEQMNVITENRSDREWFEREYMRVDWSRNMIDNSIPLGSYSYQLEPTDYATMASDAWNPDQDPGYADPYRTRLEFDEGYFETTTVYTHDPDYYACWDLSGNPFSNCEGGRVVIRHSFLEVPEKKTFEPFNYVDTEYVLKDDGERVMTARVFDEGTGFITEVECDQDVREFLADEYGEFPQERCRPMVFDYFQRFGYFRTENVNADKENGVRDHDRQYWANHFNIWQTAYDEDGDWIDPTERKPKPIVYHLNAEYPRDMIPAAKEVERQWDKSFLEAVSLAKGVSIDEVKSELNDLYGDERMFKIEYNSCMPNMLAQWYSANKDADSADRADVQGIMDTYLAASDVQSGSLEDKLWGLPIMGRKQLCSDIEYATELRPDETRFTWEREGDLRYSFFSWVEEDNAGWLGYGPSAADPLTGEIISGGAHLAGATMRGYAYYAADQVMYMNGELGQEELYYGDHIREAAREQQERTMSQSLTPQGKRKVTQIANRDTGLSVDDVSKTSFSRRPTMAELPDLVQKTSPQRLQKEAAVMAKSSIDAQRADTRFQEFMELPQVKSMMLADPNMNMTVEAIANSFIAPELVDDEDRHLAYLQLNVPRAMMWRENERSRLFAEHNILTGSDFRRAIDSLITYEGVAERFRGKSRDEIARYFLDKMTVGTQLHEVGHTIGLRHNFNASMDALNYHDEYWLIQKAIAEGVITEEEASSIGIDKAREILGGEWLDEEDVQYLNEAEFRLASVMDYTSDLTGRFAGLGKYDHAAINFVYARHVEVWDDETAAELPNGFDTELWLANFKELPEVVSGMPASEEADTARRLAGIDRILNGRKWVPIQEARNNLREGVIANTSNFINKQFSANNQPYQNLAVPYNFCSDDRRDFLLGCDVFDWGSSHREIVNHNFNTYRLFQPFYRNRRDLANRDTINSYYSFVIRTFFSIERPFRYYSIYKIWDLGSYTDDLREAAIDAANFYSEVLAMPEPGVYCKFNDDTSTLRWDDSWYYDISNAYLPASADYSGTDCENPITIQPGMAQYYGYELTADYAFRVDSVGTFIDKLVASQLLFFVSANYLYNSFITDTRSTNVSYWTLFKDEMLDTLRGIILNDYSNFGGVYVSKEGSQGNYVPPLMVDRDAFTHGVPNPQKGEPRIFTQLSFNHEFNMLAYALISNSTWQDRHTDFAQYVRIGVGDIEAQNFGGADTVEFINPETNQRYVAPQTSDGKSISVDLINWANSLKGRWLDAERDLEQSKAFYDQLREAYGVSFNPNDCENDDLAGENEDLRAVCGAMREFEQDRGRAQIRSEQLQDVIAKIELLRWLWGILGPDARY